MNGQKSIKMVYLPEHQILRDKLTGQKFEEQERCTLRLHMPMFRNVKLPLA